MAPPRGPFNDVAPVGGVCVRKAPPGRARVAPVGGVLVRKAPLGPLVSLEVQFALFAVQLLLLADVLPHPGLIQAHRADTVSR